METWQKVVGGCGCAVLAGGVIGLLTVVGGLWGAGLAMNGGPVQLSTVTSTWIVEGPAERSADRIARAVERDCAPMSNGVRVLFNHVWYNAMTSGYDTVLWMKNSENYQSYALYAWGNHVFLRDEDGSDGYRNRVLTCTRDASSWTTLD